MKRRILSILTALALCLGLLPAPVGAAESTAVTITGRSGNTVTLEPGMTYVPDEDGGVKIAEDEVDVDATLWYEDGILTVCGDFSVYGSMSIASDLTVRAGNEDTRLRLEGKEGSTDGTDRPALSLNGHTLTLDSNMYLHALISIGKVNVSIPVVSNGTIACSSNASDAYVRISGSLGAENLALGNVPFAEIFGQTDNGPMVKGLDVKKSNVRIVQKGSYDTVVENLETDTPVIYSYEGRQHGQAGPYVIFDDTIWKYDTGGIEGEELSPETEPVCYSAASGWAFYQPAEGENPAVLTLDGFESTESNVTFSCGDKPTTIIAKGDNTISWIHSTAPVTLDVTDGSTLNAIVEVAPLPVGDETKISAELTVSGAVTLDNDMWLGIGEDTNWRSTLTVLPNAELTIPKDSGLDLLYPAEPDVKPGGKIVNDGTIKVAFNEENTGNVDVDSYTRDLIEKLGLTGDGEVQASVSGPDGSITTTRYTNDGKILRDSVGDLDLHNATADQGNLASDGYHWDQTGKTLTLAEGFNADSVILPDTTVYIVTEGESTIGKLDVVSDEYSSPHNAKLFFSGDSQLTVAQRIAIDAASSLTVEERAILVAEKGITIGESGVDGYLEVNGTLISKGYRDDLGPNFAIYAGRVAVGSTGVLEVSGERGVLLAGMDGSQDFSNLFTIAKSDDPTVVESGRFTAKCPDYNVIIQPAGSFPQGTTAQDAIPLSPDFLPGDCEAKLSTDGSQINLVVKGTDDIYRGAITIHLNHNWLMNELRNDGSLHWHPCSYEGCDKQWDPQPHSLKLHKDSTGHWQECTADGCGYESAHETHTPGGDYQSDGNSHWKTCTVCHYETRHDSHTPGTEYGQDGTNHWKTCTVCGNQVNPTAHSLTWRNDGSGHWQECGVCGYKTTPAPHGLAWRENDAGHWQECVCGYKTAVAPHTPGEGYRYDGTSHWKECTACGHKSEIDPHVYDNSSDTSCNLCGYTRPLGGTGGNSGESSYRVILAPTVHGRAVTDHAHATAGTLVTLTLSPDSGYVLHSLTVTDSRGNAVKVTAQGGGKSTFTMPGRTVTVNAVFAPLPDGGQTACGGGADCPSRGFTDLGSTGTWYHEAVDHVLRNRLMSGYGNGLFGPNDPLSRAQFAQILYNQAGKPAVTGGGAFADVASGTWCANAVAWASERGIVGGYGGGRFGPNDPITREQLALMLWRYAGNPAATEQELHFADADEAGAHAREALRWAVETGVLNGYEDGRLNPQGRATRAQAAQMLTNFLKTQ